MTLLRELDAEHVARTKTAVRIKKEEDAGQRTLHDPNVDEILENLRTMELEAIQYLSADYQPTRQQSDASIQRLVKNLSSYNLTKAEKLQIVNLAPTEPVELYVIVEELEDRLGNRMGEILGIVRNSLDVDGQGADQQAPSPAPVHGGQFVTAPSPEVEVYAEEEQYYWAQDVNDVEFDDMGEGAGIEGDLDVEIGRAHV